MSVIPIKSYLQSTQTLTLKAIEGQQGTGGANPKGSPGLSNEEEVIEVTGIAERTDLNPVLLDALANKTPVQFDWLGTGIKNYTVEDYSWDYSQGAWQATVKLKVVKRYRL